MSHVITCKVEMHDRESLLAAAEKLGLTCLGHGTFKMYGGSREGIGFTLPDWRFPVVIDEKNGEAYYDNFNGSWGKQIELDKLVQGYSIEVAQKQAIEAGYTVETVDGKNGDVELLLTQVASV